MIDEGLSLLRLPSLAQGIPVLNRAAERVEAPAASSFERVFMRCGEVLASVGLKGEIQGWSLPRRCGKDGLFPLDVLALPPQVPHKHCDA